MLANGEAGKTFPKIILFIGFLILSHIPQDLLVLRDLIFLQVQKYPVLRLAYSWLFSLIFFLMDNILQFCYCFFRFSHLILKLNKTKIYLKFLISHLFDTQMIIKFPTLKVKELGQIKKSIIFSVNKIYFVDRNFTISDH